MRPLRISHRTRSAWAGLLLLYGIMLVAASTCLGADRAHDGGAGRHADGGGHISLCAVGCDNQGSTDLPSPALVDRPSASTTILPTPAVQPHPLCTQRARPSRAPPFAPAV